MATGLRRNSLTRRIAGILRGVLLKFLQSYVSGYTADYIIIADLIISGCGKRQTLSSTTCDALALVKFADFPSATAQAISATVFADFLDITLGPLLCAHQRTPSQPSRWQRCLRRGLRSPQRRRRRGQ